MPREGLTHLAGKVISLLRGDAMLVAMEVGREKMLAQGGIKLLADTIRDRSFPAKQAESRELFRQGQ